jgi:hypothetical protein
LMLIPVLMLILLVLASPSICCRSESILSSTCVLIGVLVGVVYGVWCMSVWCVVCGVWCVVNGV